MYALWRRCLSKGKDDQIFLQIPTSRLPWWLMVKNPPDNTGHDGSIPGLGRSPGEGNGKPLLAWKIPWTEEAGGLQYMGSQRVRHDLGTK